MLLAKCFCFSLFLEKMLGFHLLPLAIQSNESFVDVMCCVQSSTLE